MAAEAVAKLRFVRMAPRKTRVFVDLIRGRGVPDALATLKFTPRAAARVVEKVLMSAVANAQQGGKDLGDAESLRVSRVRRQWTHHQTISATRARPGVLDPQAHESHHGGRDTD